MDMLKIDPFKDEMQILAKVITSMPEKGQRVIRATIDGYTQLEISQFAGIPQAVISYYLKSFQAKVMEELETGCY